MRIASGAFAFYLLSLVLVVPGLAFLRAALFPERPPVVAIENATAEAVVIWSSTEPSPIPTGDYFLARFGFAVEANTFVMLPNDHSWDLVEVYTLSCESLAEEAVDVTTHILVEDHRNVTLIHGGLPANLSVATPSTACALVPWTPPPVSAEHVTFTDAD